MTHGPTLHASRGLRVVENENGDFLLATTSRLRVGLSVTGLNQSLRHVLEQDQLELHLLAVDNCH